MADLYSGAGGGSGTMAMVRGDGSGKAARTDDLDPGSYSTPDVLRRLLVYVRPHRLSLVVSFLSSGVSVVLQLWVPILIGKAIDALVGKDQVDFRSLGSTVACIVVVAAIAALTQWIAGFATNRLSYEVVRDVRDDARKKLDSLPFSFLDSHAHGDLVSRVTNDADAVGDGLLQGFTQLFSGVVTIVGTLVFMFSLSVWVGLVVVVLTPLSLVVASRIARKSSQSFADAQGLQGELGGFAEEMITHHSLVALFGREDACIKEFSRINADLYGAGVHSQFVSSLSNPSTRLVNNITYAVVAIVGCACVITSWPSALTIGQVQSFLAYANQYMKPFNEISGVVTQLQAAFASARRLFALFDAHEESDVVDAQDLARPIQGDIEFDHVSFGYEPSHPVLSDICIHVQPGQRYALVGKTGCGKTTLINLLMRFYDVDSGEIRVDGTDIRHVERKDVRSAFGMVLQETWLTSGTIRDNIAYGRPEATDEEIRAAAQRAHAHKFIVQLRDGYDTVLGEGGAGLSQGQRQLLCIARVMLRDPRILLLDEATSSIDTRTELQVQDAFDAMMRGRTSLVVAHRLSTVRDADCILVMDAGHIVEQGTHNELLAKEGAYAELYQSQWQA